MKRKMAIKNSSKKCITCNKSIRSKEIYYYKRFVFRSEIIKNGICKNSLVGKNVYKCAKCKYKDENHEYRFLRFLSDGKCRHKLVNEVWKYIEGECVMEPSHKECLICRKKF